MSVELEEFSFRHAFPQFREFNSAVRSNSARLEPWFWWPNVGTTERFLFILSGMLVERLAHVAQDLRYNKKFIIRDNGEFAGMIGLDDVAQNAMRAELWIFVTNGHTHAHVASNAIKLIEEYAARKSIGTIYARVSHKNHASQAMLASNGYKIDQTKTNTWRGLVEQYWQKNLGNKSY